MAEVYKEGSQEDSNDIVDTAKQALQEESANPHSIVQHLNSLGQIVVDKALLQRTKIGLVVANLKNHPDDNVRVLAKGLVAKWKAQVSTASAAGAGATNATGKQSENLPQPRKRALSDPADRPTVVPIDAAYCGPVTKNDKRNKCREFLFRAFLEGVTDEQRNMLHVQNVSDLTAEIENALWEHHVERLNMQNDYNTQIRAIKSNLGDKRNPEFNARVYFGAISIPCLTTMPSSEMASDSKKRERQKAKRDALEACQSDWDLRNVKRAKGQFPCGKCKGENTSYVQMQTRSSDEPMTTYVNCLTCGNRWKF